MKWDMAFNTGDPTADQLRELAEIGASRVAYGVRPGDILMVCKQYPFYVVAEISRAEYEEKVRASGHLHWLEALPEGTYVALSTD
jgi:hypothetical protein